MREKSKLSIGGRMMSQRRLKHNLWPVAIISEVIPFTSNFFKESESLFEHAINIKFSLSFIKLGLSYLKLCGIKEKTKHPLP